MSRNILESIARNNQQNILEESFDFTRSPANITSYNNESIVRDVDLELPLTPEESSWDLKSDTGGNYLEKIYSFHGKDHMLYFLESAVNRAEEINHHPVMILKEYSIKVVLTTDTLQDVSKLDIDLSKFLDEVFEDIHFIGAGF